MRSLILACLVLVVPAYVYNWKPIKEIAIFGELLAVSAIIMCMLFVLVDVGRPDRVWHMMPFVGSLNLPSSILGWDVLVLNIYFVINFLVGAVIVIALVDVPLFVNVVEVDVDRAEREAAPGGAVDDRDVVDAGHDRVPVSIVVAGAVGAAEATGGRGIHDVGAAGDRAVCRGSGGTAPVDLDGPAGRRGPASADLHHQ